MLVNGVLWPVMNLKKGKHRIMLLNACQNRYLNVYFENNGKRIPIEMVRVDSDFYDTQVIVNELFATLATRFEFILDLSYVTGEVMMKNNAAAPYPDGDPGNLD
jgi:spore coat protein A